MYTLEPTATAPLYLPLSPAAASPVVWRRKLNLKAKVESGVTTLMFQALSSRRCQLWFHRVNLHHPTVVAMVVKSFVVVSNTPTL